MNYNEQYVDDFFLGETSYFETRNPKFQPGIFNTSPEPGDKLQMGYKSIMQTDECVGE